MAQTAVAQIGAFARRWRIQNAISDDDVADLLDTIAEDAPVSANRPQSALHKIFKWGMQLGRKYVPSPPPAG